MKGYFKFLFWIIILFGGIALSTYMDKHLFHFQKLEKGVGYYLLFGLGVVLMVQSIFNTGNVGRTLAKYGHKTKEGKRQQTDQLVTQGPYAMMRHPMHQALMMLPLSVALQMVSPSFIFIIAPLEILLIYILIITIEERELKKRFGKEYEEYSASTPRFCLKWNCWKALARNSYWDNE